MSISTYNPIALGDWLATRPDCVQKLAREFPVGSTFDLRGVQMWLIGWTEGNMLLLTPIDPAEDYDAAYEQQVPCCAEHFREQGGNVLPDHTPACPPSRDQGGGR